MMQPPDAVAHSDSTSATDETRLNAKTSPKLTLKNGKSSSKLSRMLAVSMLLFSNNLVDAATPPT